MGVWGPGLYQNDTAEDVKFDYRDLLRRGKDSAQITQELLESYKDALSDADDKLNFWFALADVQWDMGRLLPAVKDQALAFLESGSGLPGWEGFPKKQLEKRKAVLDRLLQKLNSPQPPKKKVSQYRLYQCPWKNGDVYALPLESTQAETLGLSGCYMLLEKVGEMEYHPGHRIPVMYVKITDGSDFPNSLESYNKLKYIKISSRWIDTSFLRIPDITDQSISASMIRSIDENGFQTTYRISLIATSARSIPKNIVYIGNFTGAEHPSNEYIPPWDANVPAYLWNDLENKILMKYIE